MRSMIPLAILVSLSISFPFLSNGTSSDLPAIDRWLQAGDRDAVVEAHRSRGQGGLDALLAMRYRQWVVGPVAEWLDELINAVGVATAHRHAASNDVGVHDHHLARHATSPEKPVT